MSAYSQYSEGTRKRVTPLQASSQLLLTGGDKMRVLLISKTSMKIEDISNVTNIAYLSGSYTITVTGGGTSVYNSNAWYISIIW